MFAIKKVISIFFMPIPFILSLMLIGLLFLSLTSYRKVGICLIWTAFGCLFFASLPLLSNALVRPLEHKYFRFNPQAAPDIEYVMVLGHGHMIDKKRPITSKLSAIGMVRVMEGVRILAAYPRAKLILSGYGPRQSYASVAKSVAVAFGVAASRVILLEQARDTIEEAQQAYQVVKNHPLVVVTSATHMHRAMTIFESNGMSVHAAPTNFIAKPVDQTVSFWELVPNAQNLMMMRRYVHELLGQCWLFIKHIYHTPEHKGDKKIEVYKWQQSKMLHS